MKAMHRSDQHPVHDDEVHGQEACPGGRGHIITTSISIVFWGLVFVAIALAS